MNRSTVDRLAHWAKITPDALFIQSREESYTFERSYQLVQSIAATLTATYSPGTTLILREANSPQLILYILGCLYARCIPCVLPPNLSDNAYASLKDRLQGTIVSSKTPHEAPHLAPYGLSAQQRASILMSSGSTGTSKLISHLLEAHIASAESAIKEQCFTASGTWLLSLPLYHVSGLSIVYRCLSAGAKLYCVLKPSTAEILACTHASLVQTQAQSLQESKRPNAANLTHLVLGGSSISETVIETLQHQGYKVHMTYGSTETASQIISNGIPLPHARCKISSDTELYVKASSLFWGKEQNGFWIKRTTPDHFFKTRDLARLDNKYIRITGRKDSLFISGGENIYPEEIEEILLKHPKIIRAIVYPIPNKKYGFRPVAVVQTSDGFSISNLQEFCKSHLPNYKCPDTFYRWPSSLTPHSNEVKIHKNILINKFKALLGKS